MADNINSLLCDEESKSLCFDDDDGVVVDEKGSAFDDVRSDSLPPSVMVTPFLSEECIGWMIERERFHLVRDDYLMRLRRGELDMSLRKQALDWMSKIVAAKALEALMNVRIWKKTRTFYN